MMDKNNRIVKLVKKIYRQKPWNRAVTAIAGTIIFVTTYMLILPAITMTGDPICGMEEHTHSAECYTMVEHRQLVCPYADSPLTIVHKHDESCYQDGVLVCPLQEVEAHTHTAECYGGVIPADIAGTALDPLTAGTAAVPAGQAGGLDGSVGTAAGLTESFGSTQAVGNSTALTETSLFADGNSAAAVGEEAPLPPCGKKEVILHTHSQEAGCYDELGQLICIRPEVIEHQHTDACFLITYEEVLTCTLPEHQHTDDCYEKQENTEILPEDGMVQPEDALLNQSELEGAGAADGVFQEEMPGWETDPSVMEGENSVPAQDGAAASSQSADPDLPPLVGEEQGVAFYVVPQDAGTEGNDITSPDELQSVEILETDADGQILAEGQAPELTPEGQTETEGAPSASVSPAILEEITPEILEEDKSEENPAETNDQEIFIEEITESAVLPEQEPGDVPQAESALSEEETTENQASDADPAEEAGEASASEDAVSGEEISGTEADSEEEAPLVEEISGTEENPQDSEEAPALITEAVTEMTTEVLPSLEQGVEGATEDTTEDSVEAVTEQAAISEQAGEAAEEQAVVPEQTGEAATEQAAIPEQIVEAVTEQTTSALENAEIVTEQAAEPMTEGAAEQATEPMTEDAAEQATEGVAEQATEQITENAVEQTTEEDTYQITEIEPEPTTESETETTTAVLEYPGPDYKVRVTCFSISGIPQGSHVEAEEILPGDEDGLYETYLTESKKALGLDENASLPEKYARFFDIRILNPDGIEIEPTGPVMVEILYDEPVEGAGEDTPNANVLHFDDESKEAQVLTPLPQEANAAENPAGGEADAETGDSSEQTGEEASAEEESEPVSVAEFETDGFSVYGVIYTFGFVAEDGETYNVLGGKEVYLSTLLSNVFSDNVARQIQYIQDVRTEVANAYFGEEIIDVHETVNEETGTRDWVVSTDVSEINVSVHPENIGAKLIVTYLDGTSVPIHVVITGQKEADAIAEDGTSVSISAADRSFLPESARASVFTLTEEEAQESVEKIEGTAISAEDGSTQYQVFDISLNNLDTDEYDKGFKVELTLPESLIGKDFELYHIHEGEVSLVDIDKNSTEIDSETGLEVVSGIGFNVHGFSGFVLKYTVDFHYQGVDYSIPGQSQILLSELIDIMNITNGAGRKIDVTDVDNVVFTNDHLVKVEQVSGLITYNEQSDVNVGVKDFLLTSEAPFTSDEQLIIIMSDGKKIVVDVTDAISDLGQYLKDVSITGTETENGKPKVKEGVPYTVDLKFGVRNSVLFNQAAETMNFTALEGFTPSDTSGTLTINGNHGDVKLDYSVSNGVLTIQWQDMDSDAFKSFADTEYSEFALRIDGVFTKDTVKFTNTVTKEVVIDTRKGLAITKSGTYNPKTNAIDYTVTVTASGNNTNVHIGDTISGTALSYNNDLVVTSSKGSVSYSSDQASGETFGVKIDSVKHGEVITLKYSAAVSLTDVTGTGTVAETGNTANTKSTEDQNTHEAHTEGDWLANKISASTIGKSAGNATVEKGKTYIPWTITVNEAANVSMAGVKVSDSITTPDIMRYYGSGIHVEKYNKDGSPAGNFDVPWSSMISKNDSNWTYQISDSDTGNYKYVITYHTEVDSDNIIAATSVSNEASYDYKGGSSTTSGKNVTPTGETVNAEKNAGSTILDAKNKTAQTTWEIKFTVPSKGLDSCVVTDNYPVYSADNNIYDTLKTGTENNVNYDITATTLLDGEHVEINTADPKKAVLTFYKTAGTDNPGLNGTGAEREITVRLTTVCNSTWATYEEQWQKNHINNATVNVNGQDIKVSANVEYDFTEKTLTKTQTGTGKLHVDAQEVNYPPYHIDAHDLPAFQYEIRLTGINDAAFDESGNLVITDTFDPTYVKFDANTTDNNSNNDNGKLYVGNVYWAYNDTTTKVEPSVNDNTLAFTLNKDSIPKNESNYYDIYTIRYYLTVKDRETLAKMNQDALNNEGVKVSFDNTAYAQNFGSSTVTTDYETDVLTKTFVDKGTTGGNGYEIEFTLDVNPDALKIGDSDTITLTDSYKNLSLDYATITINPDDDVIVNRSGNSIIFTLKNETHYTIKYKSRVLGTGQVTWSNEANLEGQKESTSKTVTSNGSGSSTAYNMKVLKHAEGNIRKGLQAKFDLYERKDGGAWSKIYSFETDPATGEFDIEEFPGAGNQNRRLRRYSHHNTDGEEVINPENEGYEYYIVETRAPAGYTLDTTHYMFRISDVADYSTWTFLNDDIVAIVNKPNNDVSVEKTWVNADGTSTWPAGTSVTFTLKKKHAADGTVSDLTREDLGKKWTGFTAEKTLTAEPDGALWEALPALPNGYSYVVVESAVSGYTSYAADEEGNYKLGDTAAVNGNVASFANTATPPTVKVDVEKVWDPQPTTPTEAKVTVQLKRARTLVFGVEDTEQQAITEAGAENYGDSVEITYNVDSQKWVYAFEDLPKYGVVTVNGNTLYYEYEYSVEEVGATPAETYNKTVVTSEKVDDNLVVSIANSHEDVVEEDELKVTVVKQWKDSDGNIITDSNKLPTDAHASLVLKRRMSYEVPDPIGTSTYTVTGGGETAQIHDGATAVVSYEYTNEGYVAQGQKMGYKVNSGAEVPLTESEGTFSVQIKQNSTIELLTTWGPNVYQIKSIVEGPAPTHIETVKDFDFNSDDSIRVDLPFGMQWSKEFPKQKKYEMRNISEVGEKNVTYNYYVEEILDPNNNWTVEYSKDANGNILGTSNTGTLVVNNVLPKQVKVTKEWKDRLGVPIEWPKIGDSYNPASIEVKLQRRIEGGKYVDVPNMAPQNIYPEENGTQHTYALFENLSKDDGKGHAYEYTVVETRVEGYQCVLTDNGDGTIVLTNYEMPTVSVTVNKTWDNAIPSVDQPNAVRFTVYAQDEDNGLTEVDVEGNPILMVAGQNGTNKTWSPVTLSTLPKYKPGTNELMKYVVQETGVYFGELDHGSVPDGAHFAPAEVFKVTGSGGTLTFEDDTATAGFNNEPATVDVPLLKNWELEPNDAEATSWTATFQLQRIEVLVSGDPVVGAISVWENIDQPVTISGEIDSTDPSHTFQDLPLYHLYPNGSVYRIIYSVDETAYTLKNGENIISSWSDPNETADVGTKYSPVYMQDAGEYDNLRENPTEWYTIKVTNTKEEKTIRNEIDFDIHKVWNDGTLDDVDEEDAYAKFYLYRREKKGFRDLSNVEDINDLVTVNLKLNDGTLFNTITSPRGADIYIDMTVASGNPEIHIVYPEKNGDQYNNRDVQYNFQANDPREKKFGPYKVVSNGNVMDITLRSSNGSNIVKSEVTDLEEPEIHDEKIDEFTLRKTPGEWRKSWTDLPTLVEDAPHERRQTVYQYSYYFDEVECYPSDLGVEFTKSGMTDSLGDIAHRIDTNASVTATNKPVSPFIVKKEWHHNAKPDEYPEIRFTLYQGLVNSDGKVLPGQPFVDANGNKYENIPLNSNNNWTWECPAYLPTQDNHARNLGYYVMESTNGNNARIYHNSTFNEDGTVSTWGDEITNLNDPEKNVIQPWDYYNDQNKNHGYTGTSGQLPVAWNGGIAGNSGTLFIVNRVPKYKQMDIKKKIMEIMPDGSLATTTQDASRTKDIVLEIQLMRRVIFYGNASDLPNYNSFEKVSKLDADLNKTGEENAVFLTDWEDYGVPFMVGYDSNGNGISRNPNPFELTENLSPWHWTIHSERQENGLPAYGYYTLEDGTIVPVRYRYIPFEIGAYKNFDREPVNEGFDWFYGLQPAAWDGDGSEPYTFPTLVGQDQDRLMNIQSSDMYVEKLWEEDEANDIEEIYIKLWRCNNAKPEPEDVTHDLAVRTQALSQYGFVDDPTQLSMIQDGVLVLRPGDDPIHINGLWLVPIDVGGANYFTDPYKYWIEEVGYKDKYGVYTNASNDPSPVSKFNPRYDRWNPVTETWEEIWSSDPRDAMTSLTTLNRNRLRANNNNVADIKVYKEWYDENGVKLQECSWVNVDSVSFKITQIAQQYKNGSPVGDPVSKVLTFNGVETLSINKGDGKRAQVKPSTPGNSEYSVTYAEDRQAVGESKWLTIVDGLEKRYTDPIGQVWHFTYNVDEKVTVERCDTTISNNTNLQGGETVTIKNKKIVTSLAIEKVFAGNAAGELSENQKKTITFIVTGPNYNETFYYGIDDDDKHAKWEEDGTLVIKEIQPGEYTVNENHATPADLFYPGTEGASYTYSVSYTVGTTTDSEPVRAVVESDKMTRVTVTNTYEKAKLIITKDIGGDLTELPAGKTITFTVNPAIVNPDTGVSRTEFKYPTNFTDGTLTLTQKDGVKPDTLYTVTESSGMNLTGYTRTTTITSSDGTVVTKSQSDRGAITGKDTTDADEDTDKNYIAKIDFENDYVQKKIEIPVEKIWENEDGDDDWPEGVTVKVTLYKQIGDTEPVTTNNSHTLDKNDTSYIFEDLPEYEDETLIIYSVDEEVIVDNNANPTFDKTKYVKLITGDIDDGFTVTNKFVKKGALKIAKTVQVNGDKPKADDYQYVDGDYVFSVEGPVPDEKQGQESNPDSQETTKKYVSINVSNGVMASYKLADTKDSLEREEYISFTGSEPFWVLISELDEGNYIITEEEVEGMVVSSITGGKLTGETGNQTNDADLDKRTVTVYVTAGDTDADDAQAQVTFTNELFKIDIKIEKKTADSIPQSLSGAVFKLSKQNGLNAQNEANWEAVDNDQTDNEGKFTINDGYIVLTSLQDGTYKLEEVSAPAGYIIKNNIPVMFTVTSGNVIPSSNILGTNPNVTYTAKKDGAPDTYTIPNEAGAALPAAGGTGTTLFYLIGVVMTLGTGLLLVQKRRMTA